MKSKIKTLDSDEMMENFMQDGSKRDEVFKKGHEHFYIAKLQDLTEITKPPIPPIRAKVHTLLFLTSGVVTMKIGFYPITVYKNECIVIPAGQVFSRSIDEFEKEERGDGFICGFSEDFLVGQIGSRGLLKTFEFLTIWGNPIIKPKANNETFLIQSFKRILHEYSQNQLKNKLILESHLIATLCDLKMDYHPLSNSNNKTAIELTNRFKELLHQNIRIKHQVSDYSSLLHVSPNHLNKTIKLITQKSPSIWIGETLVSEAKVLLFQSNLSISEIASELGIDDQSYFSRLFKKHEGVTPIAYRKMIDLY